MGSHDFVAAPCGDCITANSCFGKYERIDVTCKVGLGLAYLSGTDDILAGVSARKQIILGSGVSPITLKVKVQADVNTQGSQVKPLSLVTWPGLQTG